MTGQPSGCRWSFSKDGGKAIPNPEVDAELAIAPGSETAVLAGGCFWCTEAVFEAADGVSAVISGYAGGTAETANYETVCSGATEHAEAIEITYDPSRITYGGLLKLFFSVAHDPTQKDRQGPDRGRQYRSAVFYADEEQKRIAEAYIAQLGRTGVYDKPIVTEIEPLDEFFPAEGYHQDFVRRNPNHPYVVFHALPKLEKLKDGG